MIRLALISLLALTAPAQADLAGAKRVVVIGDCIMIEGDERRKHRARGHKKALRIFREIGPCVKCGDIKSERHHIDDDPHNNVPENIMALCRRCHTIEHNKRPSVETIQKGIAASAALRRAITLCPQGHPYDGENLYTTPDGRRVCRECNRQAKRRYRKRCSDGKSN